MLLVLIELTSKNIKYLSYYTNSLNLILFKYLINKNLINNLIELNTSFINIECLST